MKKFLSILTLIFLLGFHAKSQDDYVKIKLTLFETNLEKKYFTQYQDDPFLLLQALNPEENPDFKRWDKLLKVLDKRAQRKNVDVQLLSDIFYKTHQHLLKRYAPHSFFTGTLKDGVFDCVTGSGAYALLLERYGIPYILVETDEHIYLKGQFEGIPFIIESTFVHDGLIIGETEIGQFEKKYIASEKSIEPNKPVVLGRNSNSTKENKTFDHIRLKELAGLQYYNDAIKKFDEKDFQGSYVQLLKAEFLYPSTRIVSLKEKMEALLGVVEYSELR
ncbi:hypothetical protein [Aquiflexum lacus]|uniref:hypothetical protein n=1 Tax=Aquiflexum lacus TaxID=2483805 RepID=UPI0018930612|nr:hypothetical protein [Aquiflexum lacus]